MPTTLTTIGLAITFASLFIVAFCGALLGSLLARMPRVTRWNPPPLAPLAPLAPLSPVKPAEAADPLPAAEGRAVAVASDGEKQRGGSPRMSLFQPQRTGL